MNPKKLTLISVIYGTFLIFYFLPTMILELSGFGLSNVLIGLLHKKLGTKLQVGLTIVILLTSMTISFPTLMAIGKGTTSTMTELIGGTIDYSILTMNQTKWNDTQKMDFDSNMTIAKETVSTSAQTINFIWIPLVFIIGLPVRLSQQYTVSRFLKKWVLN